MPTLLLADASAMIHRIIELTFSPENVKVIAVGDGDQAIALIQVERPDIVLADHAMPKRDGYEVAAFVKAHPDLAHIPVLLLAGAFEPVDNARAVQVGCDGVLVKPFEPQQVVARVRELLDASRNPATAATPSAPVIPRASVLKLVEPSLREKPPATPSAGRQVEAREGGGALDDYFDRLDAALGSLEGGQDALKARLVRVHDDGHDVSTDIVELPTVDALLAGAPAATSESATVVDLARPRSAAPAVVPPPPVSVEQQPEAPGRRTDLEALVKALGDLREDQPSREASSPTAQLEGQLARLVMTEDMIDEVARRVTKRLAPHAVSRVVSDIVTEVAERLVRKEIERISGKS